MRISPPRVRPSRSSIPCTSSFASTGRRSRSRCRLKESSRCVSPEPRSAAAMALQRLIDGGFFGRIAAWSIAASCALSAGVAILRYTLNIGSNAWLEAQWYCFAAAVMLGAPAHVDDAGLRSAVSAVPGVEGLHLLTCDASAMTADLRWEPSRGGALFPIFGLGASGGEEAEQRGVTVSTTQVRSNGAQLEEVGRLLDNATIRVAIDSVFPLADARKAHERAAEGHIRGKIVLTV